METEEKVETVETQDTVETQETKDVGSKSSDEIKSLIQSGTPETKAEEKKEEPKPKVKEEEWFDKEKGFKTKEDALKSYTNLQNTLRERAEREKQLQSEIDNFKKQAETRPLTDDEKQRETQIKEWKEQNKEAIEFLKNEIRGELDQETQQKNYKNEALNARKSWKEEFDKDDSRKVLWPAMEQLYAEKNLIEDFNKNPFPYIEAMAFKNDFSNIAERIRAEAVEQYKNELKEAGEAAKAKKTERPGGTRKTAGEVDPSTMSSGEIGNLLPRNENG